VAKVITENLIVTIPAGILLLLFLYTEWIKTRRENGERKEMNTHLSNIDKASKQIVASIKELITEIKKVVKE
jgi:hypothetical protein